MNPNDVQSLISRHFSDHVFLARIASAVNGGFMVHPLDDPNGQPLGPCAYAANAGALSEGDLVKCVRVGAVTVVEYQVLTTGAAVV